MVVWWLDRQCVANVLRERHDWRERNEFLENEFIVSEWKGGRSKARLHADGHRAEEGAYLEGLSIPVLDFVDGRHVAEVVWELVELFYSVSETDGKFL